jgi:hypothetical protein
VHDTARTRDDDPEDAYYFVVMRDPEGNRVLRQLSLW